MRVINRLKHALVLVWRSEPFFQQMTFFMRYWRTIPILPGNRLLSYALCLGGIAGSQVCAQTIPSAEQLADGALSSVAADGSWSVESGLQLQGLDAAWYNTAKGDYFRKVRAKVDAVVAANTDTGMIGSEANTLFARQLLLLYRVTLDVKYYRAAAAIRAQLADACEADSIGASCRAEPFLAEYAMVFQEPNEFAKVARQFKQRDHSAHTGADRAWLAAALVDALVCYPSDDAGRAELVAMLHRLADEGNNSVDEPLMVYAMAKGARLGYLPATDSGVALKAWKAIARPAGSEPGSGAALVASAEIELAPTATRARGETVLIDAWYNSQQRKNAAGQMESFHYKWSDMADSGYSLVGHMFRSFGAAPGTLDSAPTRESLRNAQFYLIVSPDIPVKNPHPHYMTEHDAGEIAEWVKEGGVLVMMENDPANADLTHLNLLADHFGIHFDDVLHHHILGEHVEDGAMPVDGKGPLFHHSHTLYMKDTCAISLHGRATALFSDRGDVVMASAKFGRGTVFASVDPWIYNEYADGRKNRNIYDQFDNFAGGMEVVEWLVQQLPQAGKNPRKKENRAP